MTNEKNQRGRRAFFGKAPSGVAELQRSELVEEVKQPKKPVVTDKKTISKPKRLVTIETERVYGISIDGNLIPAFEFSNLTAAANAMTTIRNKSWNEGRVVQIVDLYSYEKQVKFDLY